MQKDSSLFSKGKLGMPGDSLALKEVVKVPQLLLTCPDLADPSAQLSS